MSRRPKGYWFAQVDIANPEAYKHYIEANAKPLRDFGARFLVRSGRREVVEGSARNRVVVLEFPNYEVALECWRSADYQRAIAIRLPVSTADVTIIEGYDGPQPGA